MTSSTRRALARTVTLAFGLLGAATASPQQDEPAGGAQGVEVRASSSWKPGAWPSGLAARSQGGPVTALLPQAPSSFTPGDTVVTGPPVGLLLQRSKGVGSAKVAWLGVGYVPSLWTLLLEPGYKVVSASLLDDGTGRVLWYKVQDGQTHVKLWHTNASFTTHTDGGQFDIDQQWVPFAHSQKYAAGRGFIGFRRVAPGAANNETFFWHLDTVNGLPDQIVGGTWFPQQEGGALVPSGFAQVGRGGRLLFSKTTTGCNEGDCRLGYRFWIMNGQMQMMGTAGYESYDTKRWGAAGRLESDWTAVAQADDEILFVSTSTGEGRLRFFDRLNGIALEKVYTPDTNYVMAGYTRTAANHHVPDATEQALLTTLRTKGCEATNLLSALVFSDSVFAAEADLLARSECASFVLELTPWGVLPEFGPARARKEAVEARTTRRLQFSFYLAEVVNEAARHECYPDGSCFDFGAMCYVDPATGQRLYPYGAGFCAPDIRKDAYWAYVERTFNLALDNGFTNFILGGTWFQDTLAWSYLDTVADAPGNRGIVTRINRLRAMAAARGIPVIIGGAYDGLSLESETVFDYVWHITNTAYQAPGSGGYPTLIEDRPCHPVSAGPYCPALAWHYKYYSVVPTISIIDNGGQVDEIHLLAGLGYGSGAAAAERERRRACFLQNMFDVHRPQGPRQGRSQYTGYLPPIVHLLAGGSRGSDAWSSSSPSDFPVINCFGGAEHDYSSSNTWTHADACHTEDPVNRLLRGEPVAADCTLTVSDPLRDAQLLRTEIPPRMIAGQVYAAGAHYRHTGSTFWGWPFPVKAGLGCPTGAATWTCAPAGVSPFVAPAESRTLTTPVKAPTTPGAYALQLQPFDGADGAWFGPATTPFTVSVVAADPAFEAQFVTQSVPLRMHVGGAYTVPITFKNLGSQAWTPVGPDHHSFRLGQTYPPDWNVGVRAELDGPVDPQGTTTIRVHMVAPVTPGTYDFQWRLVKEDEFWFGDFTPLTRIEVTP